MEKDKQTRILNIREKCNLCPSFARTLHEGKIPLCISCDDKVRKQKGMKLMPNDFYKSFDEIERDYKEYWKNLDKERADLERLKNESRSRTKFLRKDYCEECNTKENLQIHYESYTLDVIKTLCIDCHKKEHIRISKESPTEKAEREERIREKAKEIKKKTKSCFYCGEKTIDVLEGISVCRKCNKKIEKRKNHNKGV